MAANVYRELQQHLDSHPVGFPAAENGADLRLLESIFTPHQAAVMCRVDWKFRTTDEVYAAASDLVESKERLEQVLDDILKRGGIFFRIRDGKRMWATAPFVIGIWELQVGRLTPSLREAARDYWTGAKQPSLDRPPQMRVIPIEESVSPDILVGQFDEIRSLVLTAGRSIAVEDCICRKSRAMGGKTCERTDRKESCMAFLDFAEHAIAQGYGRRVTAREAVDILQANQRDGLVLMPSNAKEAQFVCSCCPDCCGILAGLRAAERPADKAFSSYQAVVESSECTGCAACSDMCPMDAVAVVGDVAVVDTARCIGCGVCVAQCADSAIRLQRKRTTVEPPETWEELYDLYDAARRQQGERPLPPG